MIDPKNVRSTLGNYQLVDGYDLVVDLERSHGSWLVDSQGGREFLDCFTCFASMPLGYNPPGLGGDEFERELLRAAKNKLANSDLYTTEMAAFVEAFGSKVTPPGFPHHFWVSGGALAVENALKTAFDWKARKLGRTAFDADVNDLVVLHFRQAFHGRTGYTMSVTNTVPDKIGLFPKFDWPRVHNPAIRFDLDGKIENDIEAEERRSIQEIEAAFAKHGKKIAAILLEPMQGEGGDNHFRAEFFRELRRLADENEALLVFDEVQTGFFGSGKPWYWQHHDVRPDVVCFGKKTQICGLYASKRIDEVENNVFQLSSRINSTWGGNLVDMVRCRRFIEIIEAEGLQARVAENGERMLAGLRAMAKESGGWSNVRGCGSLLAFTLESREERNRMLRRLFDNRLLALPSGEASIRFRMPFLMSADEIDTALSRVESSQPVRS